MANLDRFAQPNIPYEERPVYFETIIKVFSLDTDGRAQVIDVLGGFVNEAHAASAIDELVAGDRELGLSVEYQIDERPIEEGGF